jgi:F-type H+-transporting ATPase subunit alpha
MKQPQYAPLSVSNMAISLFAANKGYFDDVPTNKVLAFEKALHGFIASKYAKLTEAIESSKDLNAENEKALDAAIQDFKATNAY